MPQFVVPHESTATELSIWVGSFLDPPASLTLDVAGRSVDLPMAAWKVWRGSDGPVAWSQIVTIADLAPGTTYVVRLLEGGQERARGTSATLPQALPALGAKPFICLVGSCFAYNSDGDGAAGAAYAHLPFGSAPDVKFLCGDQVYLDAPFPRYLYNVYGEDALRAELLSKYVGTWTQDGDGRGFNALLRSGPNFFASDDHEIWNNAPSATPTVRQTWWPFGDHGASWLRLALELYAGFQASARSTSFKVGQLSVRLVDTRLGRTSDRSRFVAQEEMRSLAQWIDELDGPGALVLGQPVFSEPAGWRGNFTDWGLPDFAQYPDLVRSLMRSRHDVLVLTGDVHFGRVSGCTLPSGASLIEVIASPFALVDERLKRQWWPPPAVFPAAPVPGAPQLAVWHNDAHQLKTNQFATVEFASSGSRVMTSVKAWPIPSPAQAPTSTIVFQQPLS